MPINPVKNAPTGRRDADYKNEVMRIEGNSIPV